MTKAQRQLFAITNLKGAVNRANLWSSNQDVKELKPTSDAVIALLERETKRRKVLQAAAKLALNWCTGEGQFADGNDTLSELAETVAPALEAALKGKKL